MPKIVLTLETLKAVNLFSSTEESRYYLNGVYFDQGMMIATDGRRFLAVKPEITMPAFQSFILPSHVIKAMKGGTKKRRAYVLIDTEKKEIGVYDYNGLAPSVVEFDRAFEAMGTITKYTPIDGAFPDYQRVVPMEENYNIGGTALGRAFNPELLGTLGGVVNQISIFINNEPRGPMLFRCSKSDHFEGFGAIMPMSSDEQAPVPEWFRKSTAQTEA